MEDIDFEKLKKLLKVADLIENYQYYLLRRNIGFFYIGIIGAVAIGLFSYSTLLDVLGSQFMMLAGILAGLLSATMYIFLIMSTFRIPSFFKKGNRTLSLSSWSANYIWILLGMIYIFLYIIGTFVPLPSFIYAFYLPLFIGLGNISNYLSSKHQKDYPGKIEKEYLILGFTCIATAMLIPFIPDTKYQWFANLIAIWLGMFVFGIYVVITASKIFEKGSQNGSRSAQKDYFPNENK